MFVCSGLGVGYFHFLFLFLCMHLSALLILLTVCDDRDDSIHDIRETSSIACIHRGTHHLSLIYTPYLFLFITCLYMDIIDEREEEEEEEENENNIKT